MCSCLKLDELVVGPDSVDGPNEEPEEDESKQGVATSFLVL